jgi:hypothetical protein
LVGKITALVYFQLACLPLRYASRSVRVERIRIRSAQLRGFASLNFLSELRLGQTACAYTFAILPTQKNKKQPAKNAGAPRCYAPTGVFCFLLRHSGCGFGSGGSPVPRVCAVAWCGVSGFLWRSFRLRGLVKWLLWLVFAVRVFFRRRFRRWFRRVFRRLFPPVAAWRSAALRALIGSRFWRLVVWARRFLCFRLRRSVSGAVRLRVVRRLWFRRLPLPVRAVVWSRLFLRLVRLVCFRRLWLRAVSAVSVRVRGRRWLWRSGWAFRSWFSLVLVRAFRLLLCFRFRGQVRGFRRALVVGRLAFVSCLLRRRLCLSK